MAKPSSMQDMQDG